MTIQNEWFFASVLGKANRGVDGVRFSSGGRHNKKKGVNSLRRGSKRTGLVTLFLSYTRKNLQYECNTALSLNASEYSSCLNRMKFRFRSLNFAFKWHFKTPGEKKKSLLRVLCGFPLMFTDKKQTKRCVQSVMPKL